MGQTRLDTIWYNMLYNDIECEVPEWYLTLYVRIEPAPHCIMWVKEPCNYDNRTMTTTSLQRKEEHASRCCSKKNHASQLLTCRLIASCAQAQQVAQKMAWAPTVPPPAVKGERSRVCSVGKQPAFMPGAEQVHSAQW